MEELVIRATGATRVVRRERVQSLWSGYGEIARVHLEGAPMRTVIVKSVQPPDRPASDVSHARKRRSYDVELAWYLAYAPSSPARVARSYLGSKTASGWLFVLEDLDAAGFDLRVRTPSAPQLDRCLAWLAAFHARFLGKAPIDLWETGTYWHLATRTEELARTDDRSIRERAPLLDRALRECPFQTLVHGDAKLANFCFAADAVAAVDFQYVGGGVGVSDVAYLIEGTRDEARLLDRYFLHLRRFVRSASFDALERSWRELYPVACADFHRFLAGWRR